MGEKTVPQSSRFLRDTLEARKTVKIKSWGCPCANIDKKLEKGRSDVIFQNFGSMLGLQNGPRIDKKGEQSTSVFLINSNLTFY